MSTVHLILPQADRAVPATILSHAATTFNHLIKLSPILLCIGLLVAFPGPAGGIWKTRATVACWIGIKPTQSTTFRRRGIWYRDHREQHRMHRIACMWKVEGGGDRN